MDASRRVALIGSLLIILLNSVVAQWIPTNGPLEGHTYALTSSDMNEKKDTILYAGTWNGGVFSTKDKGNSWTEIDGGTWWRYRDTGFTFQSIGKLASIANKIGGTCLFAKGASIYRSLNADTNWTKLDIGQSNLYVYTIIVDGQEIFAGTDSGVYRSSDLGEHWTTFTNALTPLRVYTLFAYPQTASGKSVLIASTLQSIYVSTDRGMTWKLRAGNIGFYQGFVVGQRPIGESCLYAVYNDRIVSSVDTGATWKSMAAIQFSTAIRVTSIAVRDTILYAGTVSHGVFFSLDGGTQWVSGGYSKQPTDVHTLYFLGDYLYSGGSSQVGQTNAVWRRPLSDIVTKVIEDCNLIPSQMHLDQNYPNPFNPSTTISFSLPSKVFVTLNVFDVMGKEVAALASEELPSGVHMRTWNASGFPSGMYFYRLQAGSFRETKRLLLLH